MSKLNNKNIKDLLSKTTVDMDLDLQWAAITEKMDTKKRDRKLLWWLLGFILVLLAGGLLWKAYDKNDTLISSTNISQPSNTSLAQNENNSVENLSDIKTAPMAEKETSQSSSNLTSKELIVDTEKRLDNTPVKNTSDEVQQYNTQAAALLKREIAKQQNEFIQSFTNGNNKIKNPLRTNEFSSVSEVTSKSILSPFLTKSKVVNNRKNQATLASIENIKTQLSTTSKPTINTSIVSVKSLINPIHTRSYVYADISLLSSENTVAEVQDNEYRDLLHDGYSTLSKLSSNIGYGQYINTNWRVNIGIIYNQYRSVYQGQRIRKETDFVQKDTATIFVNSLGGNVYQAGQVEQITTTTADIQQYSYQYSLGLNIGTRYNFYGPLFVGADVSWQPIHWQSGLMINQTQELVPINNVVDNRQNINIGLDAGIQTNITQHISIEAGLRYEPTNHALTLGNVNLSTRSLGGQVRLVYGL